MATYARSIGGNVSTSTQAPSRSPLATILPFPDGHQDQRPECALLQLEAMITSCLSVQRHLSNICTQLQVAPLPAETKLCLIQMLAQASAHIRSAGFVALREVEGALQNPNVAGSGHATAPGSQQLRSETAQPTETPPDFRPRGA